jgi:signal transduction histidine kinase/DNA-binding response OmpR family regulator
MAEPQPRVLVVDDDFEMVDLVHEVLQLIACQMLVATDGEKALSLLYEEAERGHSVDVVLLDVMMPGEDGFRILGRMKADPLLSQTPVILITGLDSVMAKARGLQMGADDYIIKPFDPQELLARIGVVLRIRRTEQMLRRRNQELAALDEINRMVSSSLNPDEVLVAALEGLERLVAGDALALVLSDEESQSWVIRTARTPAGVWLEGRVVPDTDDIFSEVITQRHSILRRDVTGCFWNEALEITSLDVLCVPLLKSDEAVGALIVLAQPAVLLAETIELMEHVAATVAVAVENARLYQELESYAAEVERSQNQLIQSEKMAAVGRLAASLAHEINNPLQAIQNSMHLVLHPNLDDEQRKHFLEVAQKEVNRLVQIVRRMLDFYRPSSAMQPLNINRPLEDALAIAGKRLQQAKVEVVSRLTPDLPPVRGAGNQLTQVFLNIIINAIEAMPEGGSLWIGTASHAERKQVVAAFRDSGPGITPEIREHLFEPFHTSKSTGTGLGLAISYGIVERHSGVIEVESPPGGGTTFIVRLPQHNEEG